MTIPKEPKGYKRVLEAFNIAIDQMHSSGRPDANAVIASLWARKYALVRRLVAGEAVDLPAGVDRTGGRACTLA